MYVYFMIQAFSCKFEDITISKLYIPWVAILTTRYQKTLLNEKRN
jgi:hypothetical protein